MSSRIHLKQASRQNADQASKVQDRAMFEADFLPYFANPYASDPSKRPLLITTGEPAGIGMDIVLALAIEGRFADLGRPVWVLADRQALAERLQILADRLADGMGKDYRLSDFCEVLSPSFESIQSFSSQDFAHDLAWLQQCLQVLLDNWQANCVANQDDLADQVHENIKSPPAFYLIDVPCTEKVQAGEIDPKNAPMVLTQLEIAHQLAQAGVVAGIVTAPLQKSAMIAGGIGLPDGDLFCGHTEYFMQRSGCDKVVMMLANSSFKVALVTTHLPLKDVPNAINQTVLKQTIEIILKDFWVKFDNPNPKILVCGLNPHAGEGGYLGVEEVEIINPVLSDFQHKGVDISLAMPADTLFTPRHLASCDLVLAMYHDQGLPVLKAQGFGEAVNLTLGLPYIRTSVDHGTALDLAGSGQASAESLWQALKMANAMANDVASHQNTQSPLEC